MLLKQQRELIAEGLVSKDQLSAAMHSDQGKKGGILLALLEMDGVDSHALLAALARMYKVPYLDISSFKPSQEAIALCSEKLCNDYAFVPLDIQADQLVIATDNPVDFSMLDELRYKLGKRTKPVFARPDLILEKIREIYQGDGAINAAMQALDHSGGFAKKPAVKEAKAKVVQADVLKRAVKDTAIIKLVNGIIIQAIKTASPEIHIEAGEGQSVVRFMLDGHLRPSLQFPVKVHPLVAARLKTMCKLDISTVDSPQEGGIRIKLWGKNHEMRVSTMPAQDGEKISIRMLEQSAPAQPAARPPVTEEKPAPQRKNDKDIVLVVDDSSSVRNLVQFVLEAAGYEIIQAEDGLEAWNMVQQVRPNLVIADCEMPNMSGPELVQRMREQQQFNDMPIVLLTSKRSEEDEVLGLEVGADDYICKPVEPAKLQARVKKTLAMYARIRRAMQEE